MCGCDRVLGGGASALLGEAGREALVERLHRDEGCSTQGIDEALGLGGLEAALAAQRDGHADDDPLGLLLANELEDPVDARLGSRPLDHADRPGHGARRIGHGDSGPRRAVVEGEHLHAGRL